MFAPPYYGQQQQQGTPQLGSGVPMNRRQGGIGPSMGPQQKKGGGGLGRAFGLGNKLPQGMGMGLGQQPVPFAPMNPQGQQQNWRDNQANNRVINPGIGPGMNFGKFGGMQKPPMGQDLGMGPNMGVVPRTAPPATMDMIPRNSQRPFGTIGPFRQMM
jgi:hypothetical protein